MKKTFFFTIVVTLILAGCSFGSETESSVFDGADSADQKILAEARKLGSIKICATASSEELQLKCTQIVEDDVTYEEAIKNSEAALCDNLHSKQLQKTCKVQIEEQRKLVEQEERKLRDFGSQSQKAFDLLEAGDPAGCEELTNETAKQQCFINIFTKLAKDNNDASYCDKIEDAFFAGQCRRNAK